MTNRTRWGHRPLTVSLLAASLAIAAQAQAYSDPAFEVATSGWATQQGGTRGGSAASPTDIYVVSSASQFEQALKANAGPGGRIIKIRGLIDMQQGGFKSTEDMARLGRIEVPANTTIIGLGSDAQIRDGFISVKNDNVIIRNLTIENPWDPEPKFDSHDGPRGNWNSQFDGITVSGAEHVWIDHVTFTDGSRKDDPNEIVKNRPVEHHDGSLDIKRQANFVTVSNCVFDSHRKNMLIGHSDNFTNDAGKLRVTIQDSLFKDVSERSPRVRFGMVHVFNNYYLGSTSEQAYPFVYALGVGKQARVYAENDAYDVEGAKQCSDVIDKLGNGVIYDHGDLLNGQALNCDSTKVGWEPPYNYALLPAAQVADYVIAHAGAGHLTNNSATPSNPTTPPTTQPTTPPTTTPTTPTTDVPTDPDQDKPASKHPKKPKKPKKHHH